MRDLELEKAPAVQTTGVQADQCLYSSEMKASLKFMERMVNQIAEDSIYRDFKYYEDKSDEFRPNEGSLMPLWRFDTDKSKKKQVTALAWNPEYHDLFAVGYGSYDFMRQGTGLVCCFSLKNTKHPEFIFTTEHGVMSLAWHPQQAALLSIGLYDGTVLVYDVRSKNTKPIYQSTIRTNKHTDPVWQVYWEKEDVGENLNFYSISSDGRVTNWNLLKNKLEPEETMRLKLVTGQKEGEIEDDTALVGLAGGMCFDFNQFIEHLFLVGTEEGKIHKCSKAYSGQYLETYEGHNLAIYSVKWNPYHQRIFLSASADWTVKLWDHTFNTPIMSFDLGLAVADVAWAPYSSTVFAAATADLTCRVYDLATDKHGELCKSKILRRGKLTKVQFNPSHPIIIVGDEKGGINCYKLSPNLRAPQPPPVEEQEPIPHDVYEIKKMEDLLATIDRTIY